MKTLHLVLKRKWWDMIESGVKTEEYREVKPYWIKRLCYTRISNPFVYCVTEHCCQECYENAGEDYCAYPFDAVTFQLGYQKNAPRITFEIEEISIGKGNPAWGAPDNEVFIIKLGERI